jgi:hypothetical protein
MLTLDFGTVLNGVAQLAGLDRDNLPTHFFKQVRDLANRRLAIAYTSAPWPDLVRVVNLTTATSDKFTMTSTMGDVIEVYQKDPLLTTEAIPQSYRLYGDGTNRFIYTRGGQTSVYVEYREARIDLTGDVWVAGTYFYNAQAYYSAPDVWVAGSFYSTPTITAANPPSSPWVEIKIPNRFMGYLTQGIYTDYLTANGTPNPLEEQKAEGLLSIELDSLHREQGQVRKPKVSTY